MVHPSERHEGKRILPVQLPPDVIEIFFFLSAIALRLGRTSSGSDDRVWRRERDRYPNFHCKD